jgi:hypothetical protein
LHAGGDRLSPPDPRKISLREIERGDRTDPGKQAADQQPR